MLPKRNRADRKQIEQIFKSGAFVNGTNLSFKFILPHPGPLLIKERGNSTPAQISFIVPKTVTKSAVTRISLRRAGYNAIKNHITEFPLGIVGVFVFKKIEKNVSLLENEIESMRNKIH